jgi:hypothetical protein
VVNIPPNVTELALDAGNPRSPKLPQKALQTCTDFGAPEFLGHPAHGDNAPEQFIAFFADDTTEESVRDVFAQAISFMRSAQPAANVTRRVDFNIEEQFSWSKGKADRSLEVGRWFGDLSSRARSWKVRGESGPTPEKLSSCPV